MWRSVLVGVLVAVLGGAAWAVRRAHYEVAEAANGRVFAVEDAPASGVAIVFGASVGSRVLKDRVATGVALLRAGKVKHLLLTGDNRVSSYDEPRAMRKLALGMGVPETALVLDYAGRRTYDSCARARSIFQVEDAVLVTQGFHLPRALYLCDRLGLRSVGVAADRQRYGGRWWLEFREVLADVRAWLDVHVRPPAVVGGPALPIRDPSASPPDAG